MEQIIEGGLAVRNTNLKQMRNKKMEMTAGGHRKPDKPDKLDTPPDSPI